MGHESGQFSYDQDPDEQYPHQLPFDSHPIRHLPPDEYPVVAQRVLASRALATATIEATDLSEFEQEFPTLGNENLPIFGRRKEIVDAVVNNPVTIVVGETGCGKSTQIPLFLAQRGFDVTQSQPRRLAARMVADRMQFELSEKLGPERAAGMVGHQTAESCTITGDTRISVITDGIQLMKQLNDEPAVDGKHVYMLDEVHEWNENMEVTIAVIKRIVAQHPGARFVLTSATMDAHGLAKFFESATGKVAPVIEVKGRMFPVERHEEPESTVADEILKSAEEDPTGNILAFVGGKQEISDTIDEIRRRLPSEVAATATILPLHAQMKAEDQDLVNRPTDGIKIIVSTNLAQTSLTLDNIKTVVDSGLGRRIELDAEGTEGLRIRPVSQADCEQRAGRTGRVGPGRYILTRYDRHAKFVAFADRPKYPPAEILSSDLDRVTLRTAAVGIDISDLDLFHRVDHEAIERAKESLYDLGAIDDQGRVTELGRQMNEFPTKVTSARMLMEALPFSEKIRAQLAAIVAAEEVGGLQYFAPDVGKAWQGLTEEGTSDLFAQLDIFIAAQDMTDRELSEHDLDVRAVRRAQELYRTLMRRGEIGEVTLSYPSIDERKALERSIYAGLINWVYVHQGGGVYKRASAPDSAPRELSNRSVLERRPHLIVGRPYSVEFMHAGKLVVRDIVEHVTAVRSPQVLGEVAAQHMISWIPEKYEWRNGVLKTVAKQVLHGVLRLGSVRDEEALDTAEARGLVEAAVLRKPGRALTQLKEMKGELEYVQQLTTKKVPQFEQVDFMKLLRRAIKEAGVFNQYYIDQKLDDIMRAENISLDRYISADERAEIYDSSPTEVVTHGGAQLFLTYRNGVPIATQYDGAALEHLPDALHLPDGREIKFKHGGRMMSLAAFRAKMELQPA